MPDDLGIPPERDADVLRRGLRLLTERLPAGWELRSDRMPEALLRAPDGQTRALAIETRRSVDARDVPVLAERFDEVDAVRSGAAPLVVARYLAPRTRELLEARGIGYVDATGNLMLGLDSPALFLRDAGSDRDPWRGPGRPRQSFRGAPAARVVRALVDWAPPVTVPELVGRAGTSTGATYRVVEFLAREALIERRPRGPIERVEWRRMLERWSEDYSFAAADATAGFLEPRGLPQLLDSLRDAPGLEYVITGSIAAGYLAPYAPARLAMLYVDDVEAAVERLGLRPVATGVNVLLAAAGDRFVFERALERDQLRLAAPSQVAVDLLTGPGRSPAEARALLDWMEADEPAWRR